MSAQRSVTRSACSMLLLGSLLTACAGKDEGVTAGEAGVDRDAGMDSGTYVPPPPECPPESVYCGDAGAPDAGESCGAEAIDLTPVGVNVMIAVDGSYAMKAHWDIVQAAIKNLIETNPTLNFGAHLFWANTAKDLQELFGNVNVCGVTENRVLDVAPDQQRSVLPFLGPRPPGPGGKWFSLRPVIDPLLYYLENDTALSNPKATNYLVLISNGSDNCFGTAFAGREDKNLTYEKLATELVKKNIKVLPIGFDGATAQRTWDGKLKTNFEALDRLAANGGTGLKEALAADSAEQLQEAVAKVAQQVRSCRFAIPDTLDPAKNLNPFELNFLVNGFLVPRDRKRAEGWDFLDGNTSEVQVFGEACLAIQAGKSLEARKACNIEEVCGTAASKLSVKARAVQYLMDRSASMIECESTEPFKCISDYGKTLSWWGRATQSITRSLVSTVNDDVEFGLQYFPGAKLEGCEVASEPEVAVTPSSEITIIGSMLANLPLGSTPLVQGLEQVAKNPGRLAEENVTSAVIVVSDGGNACGEVTQEDAVARLGAAAASLRAQGVKVYAIRFGNKVGDISDQDAQLRAIVSNGGTATGDPADPANIPYLEASNGDQLNMVLASVSDQLSTCDFVLGEPPPFADKDLVNLYINGEVIPFDAAKTKLGGWGWADEARTVIEMYGESCTQFKSNRATSTVVEYGCVSVPLM